MKEIVVISGKGGTGKTSITSSLAYLAGKDVVIADCDVDAADMHLILDPDFANKEDFYSGFFAIINKDKCNNCGMCMSVCRFNAIKYTNEEYVVNKIDCEGCGYCSNICPVDAIEMKDNLTGHSFISETRLKNILVHAELNIGFENSGKLVAKVRKEAKNIAEYEKTKYIICDGSPGIGCSVIASITGADFIVMVTEPTVSGIHDLKRVYALVEKFNINSSCIINKCDLNPEMSLEIKDFLESKKINLLAEIPYNKVFTESIRNGKTIIEQDNKQGISLELKKCWSKIKKLNI